MRAFAVGIFLAASVAGQPVAKTGPAIGDRVPDFEAVDQNGAPQSLHSLMGPKGMMLVFFRSADW